MISRCLHDRQGRDGYGGKNKPGETVPEPGESERISAERKAALQDIDRKREEKENFARRKSRRL